MPNLTNSMWRVGLPGATAGASNLTASGHYLGAVYQPIPGKTISKVGAYCTAATGSPVVDIKLESLGASSYYPSGNLIAVGASLTNQSVAASTWYNWTLTAPYAVPTGSATLLAAVIRYVSGTTVNFYLRNSVQNTAHPRPVQNQGSDATTTATPMICIEYSDGTIHPSCGATAVTQTSYNSTSNPDEYGNVFTAPVNCTVIGIQDNSRVNVSTATVRYRILDADLNVLTTDAECTVGQYYGSSTSQETKLIYFASPITLIGGRTYYVTRAATSSGANSSYSNTITFPSSAHKESFFNGLSLCTRQNDTGAFTIDSTKVEMICPIIENGYGFIRTCNTGGFCS